MEMEMMIMMIIIIIIIMGQLDKAFQYNACRLA